MVREVRSENTVGSRRVGVGRASRPGGSGGQSRGISEGDRHGEISLQRESHVYLK